MVTTRRNPDGKFASGKSTAKKSTAKKSGGGGRAAECKDRGRSTQAGFYNSNLHECKANSKNKKLRKAK